MDGNQCRRSSSEIVNPEVGINVTSFSSISYCSNSETGSGQIPDRGSCPLSTQLTEDRLRHTSGPVQPSVPLHKVHCAGDLNLNGQKEAGLQTMCISNGISNPDKWLPFC